MVHFLVRVEGAKGYENGDLSKAFGFGRLECHDNPLNTWHFQAKLYVFEFFGVGQVQWRWYPGWF